jgi:hypothetical protein
MGNKLSLILAMGIFLQIMLVSTDLIGLQMNISRGYLAVSFVNNYIAQKGVIDNELQNYVFQVLGTYIVCVTDCYASSGGAIEYTIELEYNPIANLIKGNSNNFIIRQRAFVE